jgi:hypothetical protein
MRIDDPSAKQNAVTDFGGANVYRPREKRGISNPQKTYIAEVSKSIRFKRIQADFEEFRKSALSS